MKKCPNCQKEFPDSMRFCQTDGTPLGDAIQESQSEDPLKTTVVRQEDIAAAIPPSDPFKTMVASSSNQDESGDLLQLPEQDFDPLKTMVATPIGQNKPILETPKFEDIKEEIKSESSPAFGGFSQPSEPLPEAPKDYSNDPTMLQPEPPKFNEPSVNPPSFGDSSAQKEEDELPQTIMQNQWDNVPKSDSSPYSSDSPYSNESPFAKPGDSPMSSPFDAPKSSFDEPATPFNTPNEPYNQPQSSFDQQPASFEPQTPAFQDPPATQFGGQQFDQMNQGFGGADQQMQQNDWNPPPTPEQGWGDQGLGANTPFQPPVVSAGQSQTLAIISLVLGGLAILSLIPTLIFLFCGILPVLFGIGALITGFLARGKANTSPDQYGGAGLAMGGMITGGLSLLATIGLVLITVLYVGYVFSR